MMLFLVSAGLTLIFGVMNLVNMAHGSLYMIGAYVRLVAYAATQSFLFGLSPLCGRARRWCPHRGRVFARSIKVIVSTRFSPRSALP